ncbi:MAG: large-conductance mechanosensitive channel protein MscL [Peptostreptococcaceae bacterium]|nr:large-conductance mechanosensitive channel protein MscL [Peptostreptococcaceae bacterium]
MKNFIQEFKAFALKGNVFDLAIAIIIGSAFGKIIASFVADVFMPVISLLMGNNNITELKIVLKEAVGETPELAIRYGLFIQTFIDFILIALVIFAMIKMINKMKKKEEAKPAVPTNEEILLTEIRDLLKK